MKKRNLWLVILAIALVFGMTVVGCDNDPDGGGGSLGNAPTINGVQVYLSDGTTQYTGTVDLSYVPTYDSSGSSTKPLNELIDGNPTATITEGKLKFTLGTPKASSLQALDTSNMPQGITVSASGVKTFNISSFYNSDGSTSVYQRRLTNDQTSAGALYIYSNKDVNIIGTSTDEYDGTTFTYAMNLKAGWNSVIQTSTRTGTAYQGTIKTGTPSADYKWVINQY